MFRTALIFAASIALIGCSHFDSTRHSDIQPGQTFVLQMPVEITAGNTRRFIQHGELTTRSAFDRRSQHCRLEVRELSEQTQTIQPDRFAVTRVRYDSETIAHSSPVMLANLSIGIGFSFGTQLGKNDGPPEIMELVEFRLDSDTQPEVMRLVCASALSDGHPIDYPANKRPNAKQIKLILGEIGYFE